MNRQLTGHLRIRRRRMTSVIDDSFQPTVGSQLSVISGRVWAYRTAGVLNALAHYTEEYVLRINVLDSSVV